MSFFFFKCTATTAIYTYCHTLSRHDALPIGRHRVLGAVAVQAPDGRRAEALVTTAVVFKRLSQDELEDYLAGGEWRGKAGGYAIQGAAAAFKIGRAHAELQSLMRISYAVFCLKKKKNTNRPTHTKQCH